MAAINTIDYCPTVRPTEKEFSNFLEYIEKLEKDYGDNYGMVKVKFN
jgi:[histone H3]-trimethyl-L-lysine9/36 demethylase